MHILVAQSDLDREKEKFIFRSFPNMAARRGPPQGRKRSAAQAWRVPMVTPRQVRGRYQDYGRAFAGRRVAEGGELKFLDTDVGTAIAGIGTAQERANLAIVPQNNTESGRVGRKVVIRKIHFKGEATMAGATAATSTSNIVKFMVLQDMQTNGAEWTATTLLESDSIYSYNKLANKGRFKVLKTKICKLKAGGAAPSGAAFVFSEDVAQVNFNLDCNIPIEYDDTAATGATSTTRTNSIWFVAQAALAGVTLVGTSRIRYTD